MSTPPDSVEPTPSTSATVSGPGPAPAVSPTTTTSVETDRLPPGVKPIRWMVIAVTLLLASEGVRQWQESRFTKEESQGIEVLPFELEKLPTTVGPFKSQEGLDVHLDPATVRYAGGLKSLVRTYTDELTGVRLMVLVLYGRADSVVEHVPELCYNGAGYGQIGKSEERAITFTTGTGDKAETKSALFLVGRFQKAVAGGNIMRDEAFHSFRFRSRWGPENPLEGHNRRPIGIFKIQVQRKISETEMNARTSSLKGPTEEFLTDFLPAFERLMAEANEAQARGEGTPGN